MFVGELTSRIERGKQFMREAVHRRGLPSLCSGTKGGAARFLPII
jgi:hypothetical protein